MLQGQAKIDVPTFHEDADELGSDPVMHGILVVPEDLQQDPSDPTVYRASLDSPEVVITVKVQADGSTVITTDPVSNIFENTLHVQ